MKVFDYDDYKLFVNEWIASRPKKGRGILLQISKELRIHSTMVSHIFRADKDLTLEQACSLCDFLMLNELESEFFIMLVQKSRAGTVKLRNLLERELEQKREKALELVNRVYQKTVLEEEDKAIFYSNWFYSAIRLLTSIDKYQTEEEIRNHFSSLPEKSIKGVLEFLLSKGLCVKDGDRYEMGPSVTHLEASSPFIASHHSNWRLKAMERGGNLSKEELMFSGPLSISVNDSAKVREMVVRFIEDLGKLVSESDAEELFCFNVDWVKVL